MLETFALFAVLLIVFEAVVQYRRQRRILRSPQALDSLGRRRLP
jgi:hypothetical protein